MLSITNYIKNILDTIISKIKTGERKYVFNFFFFLVLTAIMVHQYVFPLDGYIPLYPGYLEDSGVFTWDLWHVCENFLDGKNPFVTDKIYYPVGATLGTLPLMIGWFPVVLLVKVLTGFSDYYPIYAFNIIVFLSFFCSVFFTFLLLKRFGFNWFSCAIPAVAYAFSSFFYWHWKHLNLMAICTLPITAYVGMLLWEKPSRLRALLFSAIIAWSVYLTEFAIFNVMALILFILLMFAFGSSRKILIEKIKLLGFVNIALSIVVFIALTSPFLYFYFSSDAEVVKPALDDFSRLAANGASFFIPWKGYGILYGTLFQPLASKMTQALHGRETFLGFSVMLFVVIGIIRPKNIFLVFSSVLALFFIVLSLGTTLKWFNVDTGITMPYAYMMKLPPFDQNRSPVRIALIGIFFLMPFMSLGLNRMHIFFAEKKNNRTIAYTLSSLVLLWTMAEKYSPPPQERFRYTVDEKVLSALVDGPVLHTSVPTRACNQFVFQMFHNHPIDNGCIARTTPEQRRHVAEIRNSLYSGNIDRFANLVQQKGFTNIVVDEVLPITTIKKLRLLPFNLIEQIPHPKDIVKSYGNTPSNAAEFDLSHGSSEQIYLEKETKISTVEILSDENSSFVVSLYLGDKLISKKVTPPKDRYKWSKWKIVSFNKISEYVDRVELSSTVNGKIKELHITSGW